MQFKDTLWASPCGDIFNHPPDTSSGRLARLAQTVSLHYTNPADRNQMSCLMTKPTKWLCAQQKTQISLGIRPVWSESSLRTQWVAKDPSFLHADSEDSDQTGQMPRLILVFTGRTVTLLVLSWGGLISINSSIPKLSMMILNCDF